MKLYRYAPLLLLLFLLAGCGSSGTLTGKITYKDQPLNSGSITVEAAGGEVQSAAIVEDGTYTVSGLTTGPAKISIVVPPPPAPSPDGVSADNPNEVVDDPVLIPEKYALSETSGLTVTIEGGTQNHDITLE